MLNYQKTANIIRALSIISTTEAGSGHPTSAMSAADIMTVLFDKYFAYDLKNPHYINNDRFILSKGHASPLMYSLYSLAGALKREELLTLRKFGSRLEGHPTPRFPYVEVTTGSLGQGLSIAAGIAVHAKREKLSHKTYVLLGDGELAEGSNYEAGNFAVQQSLENLIAIADVNGLGQTGKTAYFHDSDHFEKMFSSMGWETIAIDGHNFTEIGKALEKAHKNKSGRPFAIIANTLKGKGVSFTEGSEGYHGKAVKKDDLEKALEELGVTYDIIFNDEQLFTLKNPTSVKSKNAGVIPEVNVKYEVGEEVATREVFGDVLAKLGSDTDIYVVDGDTGNSTFTEKFEKIYPERFIQCYIAEQNMVGVGVGLSVMQKIPFVATFGAFLSRAFDQIRMAAVSGANIKFNGSHAGISIGEDGPSQMALEDLAMFSTFPDSVVLHPCDAVSTAKLVPELVAHKGISYLRTLRPKTPVIYKNSERFKIGGSKILKENSKDIVTIAACGVTVGEALKAYELLQKDKIHVRVIDCYSVKPLDVKSLVKAAQETKYPIIVTIEDHFIDGGLGDRVAGEVSRYGVRVEKMGVTKIMRSGTKDELLEYAGISAPHVVKTIKKLLK